VQLTDRVVLVTGAASGLGKAAALAFAAHDVRAVVVNYRGREAEAAGVVAEIQALGRDAWAVQADIRDDAGVRRMVAGVGERYGRLDVLVNNAGTTHWVPVQDLEAMTDEKWHEILDTNVVGSFRCARAAAALLAEHEGMIVNLSSISGVLAPDTASSIAYSASKAALIHLTRSLAVALAPRVRVNAIAPAFTDTAWMRDHYGAEYDERVARAARAIPLGRIGRPEDMAAAIVGLVTGGDFVTGQTLLVDGGLSIV
jgi:NAD(P)-dependent dehydrogenase (short-subunit alcohol dehydrogenase family)